MTFINRIACLLVITLLAPVTAHGTDTSGEAPDFTLPGNQGSNIRLAEMRGKVILLNFWASWCGPCRQEMPALEALHQRYESAGFTVLGVNVDEDDIKANRILSDLNIGFPVVYDPTGQVSAQFDVSAMPTTIMIDRDGRMRYLHGGYKPGYEDTYREQIRTLIRE